MLQQNPLENTIREYLIASRQAGCSLATQEKYGSHLLKLANWLAKRDITRLEQVSRVLVREWGAELYEYKSPRTGRCWSPATIKQAICAARSFFKWCLIEDLIQDNVANALKIPKV